MAAIEPIIFTDITLFQVGDDTFDYIKKVSIKINTPKIIYKRGMSHTYSSKKGRTTSNGATVEIDVESEDQGLGLNICFRPEEDTIIKGRIFGGSTEATMSIADTLYENPNQSDDRSNSESSSASAHGVATAVDGATVPFTLTTV